MTTLAWAKIGYSGTVHADGLSDAWFPLRASRAPIARCLLAGCALLGAGFSHSLPTLDGETPTTGKLMSGRPGTESLAVAPPPDLAIARAGGRDSAEPPRESRFRPLVRIALRDVPLVPVPADGTPAPNRDAMLEPSREEPVAPALDVAFTPLVPVVRPPAPAAFAAVHKRKVDIEQISQVEGFSPQLDRAGHGGEGRAAGMNFAERAEAMQVPLPPVQLTEADAAELMASAPVEMTVRLGSEALGRVAFRMSEQNGIDVQLSGLLDLVSGRFAADEFARLRASASAESFVPIDQLRDAGLHLHYDPVYDELQLSA